jgi:hypothetical protein
MSKVRYHCALWTALGACRPRFRALGHHQPRLARGGIGRIVYNLGSTVGCRSTKVIAGIKILAKEAARHGTAAADVRQVEIQSRDLEHR